MATAAGLGKVLTTCAFVAILSATSSEGEAAGPSKPVAGQQVRFAKGTWSALPQTGPDRKVRQCVLVAKRSRAQEGSAVDTQFSLNIGRGAGLTISMVDDQISPERVLDDQAEILVDGGRSFPAVGFTVGKKAFAMHPGDAAGVLSALEKAETVTLRADGAGIDTGPVTLELPAEALRWLKQCGKTFGIDIDRPSDPDAPALPAPRPRPPEVAAAQPTAAGPAGIEDKQKINGWDASELRDADGKVAVCMIRRHYYLTRSGPQARRLSIFLFVSRVKGLTIMLKDSSLALREGQPIEASLSIDGKPFPGLSAQTISADEIGLYPQHGIALAAAVENGTEFDFKASVLGIQATGLSGTVAWLRACARRHGIGIEGPQ